MKLVFVSSTFKDMQFERDLLQTYAIPVLDDALRQYGEKAYFGDLRWGVNTTDLDSDEGSRKVLQVCLDQIDNCKPYMIVLIGERYGWIPAQELIDEACVLKGIEKIKDISVTELEIDYGALLDPDYEGRILFYFRKLDKTGMTDTQRRDYEAESDVHLQKVEQLKRRIQEIYPDQIRYYDAVWDPESQKVAGLEDFLSQVEKDLADVLLRDLEAENQRPWQERCMDAADRWFREESRNTSNVSNGEYDYIGSGAGESCCFYLVTGPGSSGKTVWIADSYCHFQGEKLGFVFDLDDHSRSAEDLAGVWLYKLEEMTGKPHEEGLDLFAMAERIVQLQEKADDVLHLYIDNAGTEFLSLLALIERACAMEEISSPDVFVAAAIQEELPFYPFFDQSRKVTLVELSPEDAEKVLDDIVRSHHKELSQTVKDRILSKEQSTSAAYLKSIVKRLMILDSEDFAAIRAMGDGMDNINRYMSAIVDETADDREEILLELIDEAKDRLDREFVDRLMWLFARVPVALSAVEIRDIFGAMGWEFTDLNFSLTAKMLSDVLHCDPVNRYYRLRDPALADKLVKNGAEHDLRPVAEYMLGSRELRPHAFRAAISCDDIEYLYSVLKRSEAKNVTRAIKHLVLRGQPEKAVDLLIHIALQEELWWVELLPELSSYSCDGDRDERYLGVCFLADLADRCDPLLTKDTVMLLELAIKARILLAEYMRQIDTDIALENLLNADERMRRYSTQMESGVVYGMYLTMLRIVSFSCSRELYETYIEGEHYLGVFRSEDLQEDELLRLRVYYEFYKATDIVDHELAETYKEKALQIVEESSELLGRCEEADFIMLAELTEDLEYIYLGKYLYPLSENLLRAELRLKMDAAENTDASLDALKMAKAIFHYSGHRTDSDQLLMAILLHFVIADELNPDLIDLYVFVMEHALQHGLNRRNYAELIPFAQCLVAHGEGQRLPEILKRCHWDDPFAKIVRGFIRHFYIKRDKLKLLGVLRSYKQQRAEWLGADAVAVAFMDEYFEEAGLRVE